MNDGIDTFDLPPEVVRDVVEPSGDAFRRLVAVMAKLRSPTGCPWDREQTHRTLARHLLEETYEVLEAIDTDDLDGLREELGDLVLQVVFHAELAHSEEAFTISDVLDDLRAKLIRRHPHVFGEMDVSGADEVLANWEKLKRAEKGTGVTEGIPKAMPALARASKLAKRAGQVGFDFPSTEAAARKVDEELSELHSELADPAASPERLEHEVGDVLFALAVLARRVGVEPETALRRTADRFADRFAQMEAMASEAGRDLESLSVGEWAEYWERTRTDGRTP